MVEEDITNEQMEELAEEMEKLGGDGKEYGYPKAPPKESIFRFFRHILGLTDSSKVGNLDKDELGNLKLSVRDYLDIANYAEAENLDQVTAYLRSKAETVLSTSMSKKGFLSQLFVTQIKKEQKLSKPEVKKSLFGKSKEEVS